MAKGRRLGNFVYGSTPSNAPNGAGPLTYWKYVNQDGTDRQCPEHHKFENGGHNVPHTVWGAIAPDGTQRTVQDMTIVEETDGTTSTPQGAGAHNDGWQNSLRWGSPGTAQYVEGWLDHDTWVPA